MEARRNRTAAAVAALAVVGGGVAVVHAATSDHTSSRRSAPQPVATASSTRTVLRTTVRGLPVTLTSFDARSSASGWDLALVLPGDAATVPSTQVVTFSRGGATAPFLTATATGATITSSSTAGGAGGLVTTLHLHAAGLALVSGAGPVPSSVDTGEHATFTGTAGDPVVADEVTARGGSSTVTLALPWTAGLPTDRLVDGLRQHRPVALLTRAVPTGAVTTRTVTPGSVTSTGLSSDGQGAPTFTVVLRGTVS